MKACYTTSHVATRFVVSNQTNKLTTLPRKIFGKYWSLWRSMFSPFVTHAFVSCRMCDNGSSSSWYLGNCILNTLSTAWAMVVSCLVGVELNNLHAWVKSISFHLTQPIQPTWLFPLYYSLLTFPTLGIPNWKWLILLACILPMKVHLSSSMSNLSTNYPMNVVG